MSLSLRENVTAVIETCFSETKDEIQDTAINRILELIRSDKADRKTENNSEIPNNCEHITEDGVTCAKYPACDDCLDNPLNKVKGSERLLKGKTEPTISKMEQVEGEPQTYCGDFADRLTYERGVKHAWEVAQKVFNSTVTFYEAEDVAKRIGKDINVRSKDEPTWEQVKEYCNKRCLDIVDSAMRKQWYKDECCEP